MHTDPVTKDLKEMLEEMYATELDYLAAGGPGKASFEPLVRFFADDVELHQADALPYGGIWRGHRGMEDFFLAMSRTWEVFEIVDQEYLASGNPAVVWSQVRARSRATGAELEFPILQRIEASGGRITKVHPFYWDTAAIARACGV